MLYHTANSSFERCFLKTARLCSSPIFEEDCDLLSKQKADYDKIYASGYLAAAQARLLIDYLK